MSRGQTVHRRAAEDFARRTGARYGDAVASVAVFGSVAREEPRSRSDVDLLVVLDSGVDATVEDDIRELAYDVELDHGVPLSLVVKTATEFEAQRDRPFLREVQRDAEVLYG